MKILNESRALFTDFQGNLISRFANAFSSHFHIFFLKRFLTIASFSNNLNSYFISLGADKLFSENI
jgi:hypothetical protein